MEWDRCICRRCASRSRQWLDVVTCVKCILVVPRYRLTTAGRRAFSCVGPSAWNSLPAYLKDEMLTLDFFKHSLKCFLFATYWQCMERIKDFCFNDSALYKCSLNNNNNNLVISYCSAAEIHDNSLRTFTLLNSFYNINNWPTPYLHHQHDMISSFSCDSGTEISCQFCPFAHQMPSVATFPGYKENSVSDTGCQVPSPK